MKPAIHIDEQLIRIDTDQYLMTIAFKQQPITVDIHKIKDKYPQEINVYRAGDVTNSLHNKPDAETRKCQQCGNDFILKRKDQVNCTSACSNKYHLAKGRAKKRTEKMDNPPVKHCVTCGAEYKAFFNHQKYCNAQCYPSNQKKEKVTFTCAECGKPFEPASKKARFCSALCRKNNYYKIHYQPSAKSIGRPKKQDLNGASSKAPIIDRQMLQHERKRIKAINASPDLSQKIPVKIDAKTTIYIKPGEDPEQARKNFIERHNQFERSEL